MSLDLLEKKDFVVSREEANQLCHAVNPSLTSSDLDRLNGRAQGWLVALLLGARHYSRSDTGRQTEPSVGYYLTHRVLSALDSGALDLLQRLAVMPSISRQTCQSLQLQDAWPDIQRIIEHIGLADRAETTAGTEYQLHPLLRDELTSLLLDKLESTALEEHLSHCTSSLTKTGNHSEAISLLLRLRQWGPLTHYLLTHAAELVLSGHSGVVERAITQLPVTELDGSVWIQLWLAVSRVHRHPLESRETLLRVFNKLRVEDHQNGLHLCYGFLVQTLRIALDNQQPALEFYQLWPALDSRKAGLVEKVCASIGHLHVLQMSGCNPLATACLANDMLDSLHQPLPPAIGRPLVTSLLSYYAMYTRRRDVLTMIEATAGSWFDHQCPIPLRLDYMNWVALTKMLHFGQFEAGLALLDRGIALSQASAVHVSAGIMHMNRVYGALGLRDLERARKALDDLAANRQNVMGQGGYCVSAAALSLHLGEPQQALDAIKAAYEIAKKQKIMAGLNWGTTLIAAAHLQSDNYPATRQWLYTGLLLAKQTNNTFFRLQLCLLLAELRLRRHPWAPGAGPGQPHQNQQ